MSESDEQVAHFLIANVITKVVTKVVTNLATPFSPAKMGQNAAKSFGTTLPSFAKHFAPELRRAVLEVTASPDVGCNPSVVLQIL